MDPVVDFALAVVLVGGFPALAGADLRVEPGEILLLQGPNGAGKTTLLRACAGLADVVEGRASVLGHDLLVDRRSVRRHVGLLGHESHLYDDLTVLDNVTFWARTVGATRAEALAALDRLEVPGRLHGVAVQQLSAGQRRRVAVAVVVGRRPRLWLLDEPHAGLDQAGRDVVDALLVQATGAGATVLFASHELDRAESVATRSVTVAGGVVRSGRDEAVEVSGAP